MSTGAIAMLVFGCTVLFGGLAVCLAIATRTDARRRRDEHGDD